MIIECDYSVYRKVLSARPSYIPFAHTFLRQFFWRFSVGLLVAFWRRTGSFLAAFLEKPSGDWYHVSSDILTTLKVNKIKVGSYLYNMKIKVGSYLYNMELLTPITPMFVRIALVT